MGGADVDGAEGVPRWPIPHAKIVVPRVPANFIRRKPLRDLLDHAVEAPVTAVCAPAGYGKTLLLADWIESTGEADKAWVSLDAADNDPGQFFSEVLRAIRDCESVPPGSRLRELAYPDGTDVTGFLADLVDALDALPRRLCLVLDDVHEVVSPRTLHAIETVIRHPPAALRLVLSSRCDPPLPLARLRVQGRLSVLRADDLRFSHEDADKLLEASGVSLTEDQLSRLVTQTDGWAAGLRLAARSLREVSDRDAFLADFAGDDRAVADYLVGEVLARLPSDTGEFLKVISICDEISPVLAEVLSGRDDAGALLSALERESSLVLAVGRDRSWYRVHPLLRSYLHSDLERQRPGLAADLHRVAAAWFAAAAQPRKALDHAARADERDTVVELLHRHAVALLLNGDHLLVRQALAIIGAPAADGDPWLTSVSALAHLEAGELAAVGANPVHAATAGDLELSSLRRLIASTYALASGRPGTAESVDWHDVVSDQDKPGLEAWARLGVGWALIRDGRREGARRELDAAGLLARGQGLDYLVMHTSTARGAAAGLDGDYPEMERACAESVGIARAHGWRRSPWLAIDHVMLGFAHLMRFDPVGAQSESGLAAGIIERSAGGMTSPDPGLRYLVRLVDGVARFDRGQRQTGLEAMHRARRELADTALLPELAATAAFLEYRCALALGQDSAAREVFAWAKQRLGPAGSPELSLMVAWARIAHGDDGGADRAVEAITEPGADSVVGLVAETAPPSRAARVEGWLLRCAVAIRSGRRTLARRALDNAVRLAEPDAVIRPFAHADAPVRQLLADQIGGFGGSDAFATRIRQALSPGDGGLAGHGGVDGPGLVALASAVLTDRENVVLARLTSQRSLDEIAVDLAVSVNTIKTHVRAIYAKLGVNNRRAAVVTARERGLA